MNQLKVEPDDEDFLWCNLLWDGVFWKRVYKSLFARKLQPLFQAVSLEAAIEAFKEIEEKVAKQQAIKYLSQKAVFSSELSKKLTEKGISSQTISVILAFCEKIGALKDHELVDSKIQRELRSGKGLYYAKGKWQRSLGAQAEEVEWYSLERQKLEKESIIQLLQKKGKVWNVLDRKEKNAFVLFLMRRGFRKEAIEEVLFLRNKE